MALTKIINPTANNAYKPSNSALKTFASILNSGITLGGAGAKASDLFSSVGGSSGSLSMPGKQPYTLGIDANSLGGDSGYMNSVQNQISNSVFNPGQIWKPKDLNPISPGSITRS